MKSEHSETRAASAPPQDIYANGDVIFVVGDDQRQYRVSSAVMKGASKVFRTMLSPGFSEGETLLKANKATIPLPEDDADGMFAILCVLHGRNELAPQKLDPEKIYDVAVLSDKYDLAMPLMFAAEHWLDLAAVTDNVEQLWRLMCSAYLLQCGKSFSEITRKLVIQHAGSYGHFKVKEELDPHVILRICLFLEEKRNQIRAQLLSALYRPWIKQATCSCGWNQRFFQTVLSKVYYKSFMPDRIHACSIAYVCTLAKENKVPDVQLPNARCLSPSSHKLGTDFMVSLVKAVEKSLLFEGLCRKCAQTGERHGEHQYAE